MQSYKEYDNLLSDETKVDETKAAENQTERIGVTTEREEPDRTGTNQVKHDEPESDPAYEQYLARVLEFDVLHFLHVAIVDEVGSSYRAHGNNLSGEQPFDKYKSAFNRNLSELHHEAQTAVPSLIQRG